MSKAFCGIVQQTASVWIILKSTDEYLKINTKRIKTEKRNNNMTLKTIRKLNQKSNDELFAYLDLILMIKRDRLEKDSLEIQPADIVEEFKDEIFRILDERLGE